jgi:Phosphotransferase enzyme family
MTAALAASFPSAVVSRVEIDPGREGTNVRARVHITYTEGAGPPSVFVKGPGRVVHRLALAALRAYATEARLAASGVSFPVEHPTLYAGGVDGVRLGAVVVMQDVEIAGGRPNDATTPLSAAEVMSGLDGLARLHSAYWGRALPVSLAFLRPWRLSRGWSVVSVGSLARGLRKLEEAGARRVLPPPVGPRLLARQFRESALLAGSGEQTVLHGDPHPGNTYALAGGRTGFLDWQLARVGHWSHDVGYFIVSSLDVADRRRHERTLLEGYLTDLRSAGVAVPGWSEAWARYRATPAFGLATWLHTLAFGTLQPPEVCLASIERFAVAYDDLDTSHSFPHGIT